MELRPEGLRQIFGMCMHFYILTVLIEPAYDIFNLVSACICAAHVNKEDVLDAKLVADSAHLSYSSRTVDMFAPDKTADMIYFCPIRQCFCINCYKSEFVIHIIYF